MAVVVNGTPCAICGRPITGQDLMLFPPFVTNQNDALWPFSDNAFHTECLSRHPLRQRAQAQKTAFLRRTGPGMRKCAVCGLEIAQPDNYVPIGYLTDDPSDPLSAFNYLHLHRTCL